ncbi:hypothetical protein AVEN_117494-1 [Araneus ventricosus]|uniref:Uncharacterized protein n=1 Tax=Araneus ventricosus TaxID=182803 RepID=A0A4Y2TYN2_ARAVE|nr:hypothetical protein AVEN_117494-1 [Araneus ventricosus]
MIRIAPELPPPLSGLLHSTGGELRSSVESGFEPGILRPRSHNLATKPPWPAKKCLNELRHAYHVCIYNSRKSFLLMSFSKEKINIKAETQKDVNSYVEQRQVREISYLHSNFSKII